MANIIATGSTALDSAEFTLTAADTVNLSLIGIAGLYPLALIMKKGSDAGFVEVGRLTVDQPSKGLSGAGTFKVSRVANGTTSGVDKD